jgi:hypothetical protein
LTDALPEGDEDAVQVLPESFWQYRSEGEFRFIGAFRRHQSPSVCDSVYVGVNADAVLIEPAGQYEICGLPPDTF